VVTASHTTTVDSTLVPRELGAPRHQPHAQGSLGIARGLPLAIQRPVPIPGHRPGQRSGL